MSEPIPEWCPYCGAASLEAHPRCTRYTCESQIALRRDGIGVNIQSELCRFGELKQLRNRVKRLVEAGQDAVDYIDGKHRDAGRVLDGWRKVNK